MDFREMGMSQPTFNDIDGIKKIQKAEAKSVVGFVVDSGRSFLLPAWYYWRINCRI